jgi:hypothetical protein
VVVVVGFQLPHCLVALVAVLDVEAIQMQVALAVKAMLAVEVLVVEATVAEAVVVALEPQEHLP